MNKLSKYKDYFIFSKMGNCLKKSNVFKDITEEEFYKQIQSTSVSECTQMWICVDLTSSNNNRDRYPGGVNLHELSDTDNVYIQAIRCATMFLNQDLDGIFPLYAFGSVECGTKGTKHIEDIYLPKGTVEPLIDAYKHIVTSHTLSGPTTITPIISEAINYRQTSGYGEYLVVLIITDGSFHNIKDHQKALIRASNYPIMFVVIGVGGGDFSNMQMFDDMKGRRIDNFHFVDINKVLDNEVINKRNQYFFYQAFMEVPRHFMACQEVLHWTPSVSRKEQTYPVSEVIPSAPSGDFVL